MTAAEYIERFSAFSFQLSALMAFSFSALKAHSPDS
jgi:hypothetical protein